MAKSSLGRKTRDGVKISKLVRAAQKLGIDVRKGRKHPYVLNLPNRRPCPIGETTNVGEMVVPWVREALNGVYDNQEIYTLLSKGKII
jgi:hypothetical protein